MATKAQPTKMQPTIDGRTARSARTRDAVVEAFLDLLGEGDLRPTARTVADRAGVSLRSVYVRFQDLDSLAVSAAQRQWERVGELVETVDDTAPLEQRLAAFADQRCRVLETIRPVRRAAHTQEPFSPALHELLTEARSASRAEIERVFATELSTRRGKARERLLDALDLITGSMAWESLRDHRGLTTVEATNVVDEALQALLAPAGTTTGPKTGRT